MFAFVLETTLLISISSHDQKKIVIKSFRNFDELIAENHNLCLDFCAIKKWNLKVFIFIITISLLPLIFGLLAFDIRFSIADLVDYSYYIFIHIIHVEILQILLFLKAIQHRLKLLLQGFEKFSKSKLQNPFSFKHLQNCYIKLCETRRKLNNYQQIVVLMNLMHVYSETTLNLYWLCFGLLRDDTSIVKSNSFQLASM